MHEAPEQLELMPAGLPPIDESVPEQFRLSQATRELAYREIARIRREMAERAAARESQRAA